MRQFHRLKDKAKKTIDAELKEEADKITLEDYAEHKYRQIKEEKTFKPIHIEYDDEELTDHEEEVQYYNGYYGCRFLDQEIGYHNLRNYGY